MQRRTMVIAGLLAAALALVVTGCINPTLDYGKVTIIEDNAGNSPSASPATYTVVFDKNGANATGSMDNQPYIYGVARSLSTNAYSRHGYTFAGWNTQADGSGTTYTDSADIYMRPYTFAGWNAQATGDGTTDPGSAQILNVPTQLVVTGDCEVRLYAQWEPPEKLVHPADVFYYLAAQSGGASADDPVLMAIEMALDETLWRVILDLIEIKGKFIDLDLSVCTPSDSSSGGGLRSNGVFDSMSAMSVGKNKIVNLTLPVAATGIAENAFNPAFNNFPVLKTVSGTNVVSIGDEAFKDCSTLTGVSFPSAAEIGSNAFYNCAALTSVSFPAAAAIEDYAFGASPNVLFTLSGIGSLSTLEGGKMLIKNTNELVAYPSASGAVTLPNSITAIGDRAFADCDALTSVNIPAVASIGADAFSGCSNLISASFPAAAQIGHEAFLFCDSLTSVNIPGVVDIGHNVFIGCGALNTVTLGATPPTIGTNILSGIGALTVTVKIPATAKAAYGVPNLPGTNFDNSSTANSWGRAFKGTGWGGGTDYRSGGINTNVTLSFEAYTPEVQQAPQAPQETVKITDPTQIVSYLNGKTGGTSAGTPIDLTIRMELTETKWKAILTAIKTANKFIKLDLSTCTPSDSSTGGGLRSRGDFDPVSSFSDGKNKIVTLILPYMALGDIVGGSGREGWEEETIPAFKHFSELKTITGKWLTGVGNWSFRDCGKLENVTFPEVTAIGIEAFRGCGKLTDASVASMSTKVVSIGSYAFYECDTLTSVNFPKVTSIGKEVFLRCDKLESVNFPEVTSIALAAFFYCGKLENVNFPKLTSLGFSAFSGCGSLISVDFPELLHIDYGAFWGCSKLVSISIPKVLDMDEYVFRACNALNTVTLGATPPTMGMRTFEEEYSNPAGIRQVTVNIPESAKAAYGVPGLPGTNFDNSNHGDNWGNAFRGLGWDGDRYFAWYPDFAILNTNVNLVFNISTPLGPLTNPNQIVPYLNARNEGTSASTPILLTLNMQLTEANWNAILSAINTAGKFINLDLALCARSGSSTGGGLRSGGIFDTVHSNNTGKTKIVNLTLPTAATEIVDAAGPTGQLHNTNAFRHFAALKTVSGAGITRIGKYAFWHCITLTSVSFPELTSIGDAAFEECYALTSVSFPKVTAVGEYAFHSCTALTSVSFPELTDVSRYSVFSNCVKLSSVNLPKAIFIGRHVFSWCFALTSINLPAVVQIETIAFHDCNNLTSASFPSATQIEDRIFENCGKLASVNFPKLTTMGNTVFVSCGALTTVTLGATPPTMGTTILTGIGARTVTVRIPASAKAAYGVPNLPGTNFNNGSSANSWGRAFKGTGWSGGTNYGSGAVNNNITLSFATY